jgi:hypothetical protein
MKPFHICPRCQKFYFLKKTFCKKCSFHLYITIAGYCFETDKYYVVVDDDAPFIGSRIYNIHLYSSSDEEYYRTCIKLDIIIPPHADDRYIDKLLVLL